MLCEPAFIKIPAARLVNVEVYAGVFRVVVHDARLRENAAAQQQVAEAQKTAEQAAAEKDEIAGRVKAEAEAAYKAQLDALEQKAAAAEKRAANAGNGAVQKFSVHFALLQQEHRELLGILRELRQQGETETADKLHGALQKLVVAMGQTEQEVSA